MAQQIALEPMGNYDVEGLQHLQDELHQEERAFQRQTSTEVRNEQIRIRQIFREVRWNLSPEILGCFLEC